MARVSVIMNIRDGEAYLREALDSVRAQTFADWELVAWDDRSVDDSAKIVAAYADKRIRYFLSPEATPLGRARELAIRQAGGEWLAFLDQDDIWLPRKLEKQLALVADGPENIGIVYGRTVAFDVHGREQDYDHWHEFRPLPEGDIFGELITSSGFIAFSSAMFRRSAYEQIGGIPRECQLIPDYHLSLAVARLSPARAVQEIVCRYRVHPASMSHTIRRRIIEEAVWMLDQWAHSVDPRLLVHRHRIFQTLLALEEMGRFHTASHGISRLLRQGSVGYLASRPFVRGFRALRRRLQRPYWKGCNLPG